MGTFFFSNKRQERNDEEAEIDINTGTVGNTFCKTKSFNKANSLTRTPDPTTNRMKIQIGGRGDWCSFA